MSDLKEILMLIEIHHRQHSDHGDCCACMDKYIQMLRKLTETSKEAQNRVDYFLRQALNRY